jgi:hypothetical protein
MTHVQARRGGPLAFESDRYKLELASDGMLATLESPSGSRWASLRPLAALDTIAGVDETLSVSPPRIVEAPETTFEIARRSTLWERALVTLVCTEDSVEVRTHVAGKGALADVHLLAARSLAAAGPTGFLPSGTGLQTIFSPNPGDPGRLVQPAGEPAVIGVVGDSEPGRGHWFFTPAPLYLALAAERVEDPAERVEEGWLGLGVIAPVGELTFVQLVYVPADRGFSLRLEYEGHTPVDGEFEAPAIVLTPGIDDPYDGLRRHRHDLVARAAAPPATARVSPSWWTAPIFCGWGAQRHLAATTGGRAADHSTEADYEAFLAELERHEIVPGTVVIDDKWQEEYGTCTPDRQKWPDLRRWISERHDRGQRVLLWWKAWDPEGLPAELCIRNPHGAPVAVDPSNPAARAMLRRSVQHLLASDGIDADGLKLDFTAASPSGRGLASHGDRWGIALLHELLSIVYLAAKEAKPDALLITHTPHPAFADVSDMLRLNDMLRLDDEGPTPAVVPQMRHRARVIRAACPELPIDTDDWCAPDLDTWREYVEVKPQLGVPALYYATHLDATGERLTPGDYDALRRTWSAWAASR